MIRAELKCAGYEDELPRDDQDCAIDYFKWALRFIPRMKRQINKAHDFECPEKHQAGLRLLEDAIVSGADLTPWLSRNIGKPKFHDGIFFDWKVSHFHLGETYKANGMVEGHDEVLFAVVTPDSVFEIGIYVHGSWHEVEVLDVIDRNWPHLLDSVTLRGLSQSRPATTSEEALSYREMNVLPFLKLPSGRLIAPPGGGVATDGTPIEATMAADMHARYIRTAEERISAELQAKIDAGEIEKKDYEVLLRCDENGLLATAGNLTWRLGSRRGSSPPMAEL